MGRIIKILASVAGVVLGLVVALVIFLELFIDPNDYRDEIGTLVRDNTGMELKLSGDLEWSFYPVLGFEAQQVSLAMSATTAKLLELKTVVVGVKLIPLLSKEIQLDALEIDGLDATLVKNASGETNWTPPAVKEVSPAPDQDQKSKVGAVSIPEISIPLVAIRNSQIKYEDQQAKQSYTVDISALELQDVSTKEAFPLSLKARIRDNAKDAKLDVNLTLASKISANLATARYDLQDIDLDARISGVFDKPVDTSIKGSGSFDKKADEASATLTHIQFANVPASANFSVKKASIAPAISGQIKTEKFDLKQLLGELSMPPLNTQDAKALTAMQADIKLSGTPQKIDMAPLQIKLDDSVLSGNLSIVDVAKQALQFNLKINKINLDRYLSTAPRETSAAALPLATAPPNTELIPVKQLRGLTLSGTLGVDEMILKEIPIRDVGVNIYAANGDLKITNIAAKLLDGSLNGDIGVDVRGAEPVLSTKIDLNNLQMGQLLKPFVSGELLTGNSSLNLTTTTQGNDSDRLLKQALGVMQLDLVDGLLHGVNLNELVVNALNERLGNFAALVPDYQNKLPKALKQDTSLKQFKTQGQIANGIVTTPNVNADTDAGKLSGNGTINLLEKSLDYRFGVNLTSFDDHKYLKGTAWPVHCQGKFDQPVKDWCRPDTQAIGQVLENASKLALKEKAAEKIGEKLGSEGGASKDAVKEEAKKKLNEKLNQFLNKKKEE